ncbi:FAD-binding protein [Proteiniphilum sp.]|uniref:FAD-binding protein n=1 Tax=Proteiniphilum sp. TaxID=1926877 RepID=UPI002B1ED2D1|nr:FAD-binding protein [Proteiniphilum sp.]MEA4917131.1 FAD-binding protein [Proteiniphilum sp.]
MPLTIISLIKQVPLPSEMRMGDDGLMDRTKAKSIINIDCQFGLEAGLQIRKQYPDARLIVCSMGPQSFEASLRKAISMGYDEAYLLSDRKLGGSDTYATGLALATLLKHLGFSKKSKEPFIIFAGRQTSDGDTAHVPSQVAENLGIPQATFIESVKADGNGNVIAKRIIEGGYQMLQLPLPCAVSLTPTGVPPRKPSLSGAIKARKLSVTVFSVEDIGLSTAKIGLSGSPTIVANVTNMVSERSPVLMSQGNTEKELVESLIANFERGGNVLEKKEEKEKREVEIPDFPVVDNRNGAKGILTWAEITNGKIARPSLELLTPARHLADQLGNDTKITTVLIGKNVEPLAQTLFEHGTNEVVLVEDNRLEEYLVLPFSNIITQIIHEKRPEITLFAATTAGRELAPRTAVKTGSGVTADCTGLEIGEYINRKVKVINRPILHSRRPTYGESKLATILGFSYPQISTARAGTFEVPKREEGRKGILSVFTPTLQEEDFRVQILQTVRGEGGLQDLFDAEVIVSGGRGTVEDNMKLVQELAEALKAKGIKAEWACSRVVVDEGLSEYARQIGQTGKTVRPKIYIAVGISGAIQHIAGIKESGKIIAIDHNAKASIFHHADFGVVGEYQDILPELIERVKNGFTFGLEPMRK